MFYRQTIKRLKDEVEHLRTRSDTYWRYYEDEQKKVQDALDANVELSKDLDLALESASGYDAAIESLETRSKQLNSINVALADENRDLVRQLELYKALLSQLQITVKLPVRQTK